MSCCPGPSEFSQSLPGTAVGASTLAVAKAYFSAPQIVPNGTAISVSGRTVADDGYYGGVFNYDSSDVSSTFPNDALGFVDNIGRRFKRQYNGFASLMWFATGNNVADDTTAVNNWIAAIINKSGYIPVPPVAYYIPSGVVISGHTGTRIICDPNAIIRSNLTSTGAMVTILNSPFVDLDFPIMQVGGSPGNSAACIKLISSSPSFINAKVGVVNAQGPGKQTTKPATAVTAGNSFGVYIEGPTVGNANYYHIIKPGSFFTGFDTIIACYTPVSVGSMNANANDASKIRCEGFWYGCYTNSVENQFMDNRYNQTSGPDGSHLVECVHIGDATYTAAFNRASGVAETGANSQVAKCDASSFNNRMDFEDNLDHGPTDNGSNDILSKNQWLVHSVPVFLSGFLNGSVGSPSIFGGDNTVGMSFAGGIPALSTAGATNTTVTQIRSSSSGAITASFYGVDAGGANAGATALGLGKNNGTSRSINAGGTINASGADYAEYEFCGTLKIAKGAIVGFKKDGTLTLTFSEAVRFGVKSSNPNLVGGDMWGTEDTIGTRPQFTLDSPKQTHNARMPKRDPKDTPEQMQDKVTKYIAAQKAELDKFNVDKADYDKAKSEHEAALKAWEAKYEAERVKWDRIAYCGKVPCYITGTTPGDYILAAAGQDGMIIGEATSKPSFDDYLQRCVGRVNRILPDGRAEIVVKVG